MKQRRLPRRAFSACGKSLLVRSLRDYMNLTLPMRAKNLADTEGLALSRRQHEFMIELLQAATAGRWRSSASTTAVQQVGLSRADRRGSTTK